MRVGVEAAAGVALLTVVPSGAPPLGVNVPRGALTC